MYYMICINLSTEHQQKDIDTYEKHESPAVNASLRFCWAGTRLIHSGYTHPKLMSVPQVSTPEFSIHPSCAPKSAWYEMLAWGGLCSSIGRGSKLLVAGSTSSFIHPSPGLEHTMTMSIRPLVIRICFRIEGASYSLFLCSSFHPFPTRLHWQNKHTSEIQHVRLKHGQDQLDGFGPKRFFVVFRWCFSRCLLSSKVGVLRPFSTAFPTIRNNSFLVRSQPKQRSTGHLPTKM